MYGQMRRISHQRSIRPEQCAGEIEPLLDVDRHRGALEGATHLLGDAHKPIWEGGGGGLENIEGSDGCMYTAEKGGSFGITRGIWGGGGEWSVYIIILQRQTLRKKR